MQSFTQIDRGTIEEPIDLQVEVVDGKFLADTQPCYACGSAAVEPQGSTLQKLINILF